ncbi:hypothetical protein [Alkalinema pantanalense]|uniref:hypothetical protein n=1 Tax=Alkalinema pantanalense TaxID=1620705 RepID=UPI003D6FD7AE
MQFPKAPRSTDPMPTVSRSIFREEAVRRYVAGQESTVLPRLVSPRTFAYLWMLLGVLGMSSTIAWLTKIPAYLNHEHFQTSPQTDLSQPCPPKSPPSKSNLPKE